MGENYYALAVSIIKNCTPEQAFKLLETGKKGRASKEDTQLMVEEMRRLHNNGKTYRWIAKLYGTSESNVYRRLNPDKDNKREVV